MKKFYTHNGKEQEGPYDLDDLISKNINKDTEIWYEGLSDWKPAGQIEELKELFELKTPPPIKPKVVSTTPPVAKPSMAKKVKPKEKTPSWFSVIVKTVVSFTLIMGCYAFYEYYVKNTTSPSYEENYDNYVEESQPKPKPVTYEQRKMTVAEIEKSQPLKFLSVQGSYKENFLGDKLKLDGKITNNATIVSYKDAVVRVTYYSKTNTKLESKDYTIWEVFSPNQSNNFQLKIQNYSNVGSIKVDVVQAEVY